MNAFATSAIRTIVGYVVAWLLSMPLATPLEKALGLMSMEAKQQLTAVFVLAIGSGYYLVVRGLEERFPWTGVLLGAPVKPTYSADEKASTRAETKKQGRRRASGKRQASGNRQASGKRRGDEPGDADGGRVPRHARPDEDDVLPHSQYRIERYPGRRPHHDVFEVHAIASPAVAFSAAAHVFEDVRSIASAQSAFAAAGANG